MKISSFITLKEISQESDKKAGYGSNQYISPEMGVDIYIRAVDRITKDIKEIADLTAKIFKLNNSQYSKDKADIPQLKQSLAEQYLKTRTIIEEFIKGFSLTHDEKIKELVSIFYRSFDNILERYDLAYLTSKPAYYNEALARLKQTRDLFTQMLEILQKETENSQLQNINTSNTEA